MLNIDQAKSVPLENIFAYIAKQYPANDKRATLHYKKGHKQWFYAWDRQETKASVVVDTKKNIGHDFGKSNKAHFNPLDLTIDFMGGNRQDKRSIREALQLLEAIDPNPVLKTYTDEPTVYSDQFRILKRDELCPRDYRKQASLRQNLSERKISVPIAKEFMEHAFVKDTKSGRTGDCFVWPNVKGGQELSKPGGWKNCIGPKAISVFPQKDGSEHIVLNGTGQTREAINHIKEKNAPAVVFEGMPDYLTYLTIGNLIKPEHDSVYTFMDNDPAGKEAELLFADELEAMDWSIRLQNHIYEGYKDLNAWHAREVTLYEQPGQKAKGPTPNISYKP